jgi:hypothetical protein
VSINQAVRILRTGQLGEFDSEALLTIFWRNMMRIRMMLCLLFMFSGLIVGCEQKSKPIILGDLRAGDTEEEIIEKIKSNSSLSYIPVIGLFSYEIESWGALPTILVQTEDDGLVGATLIGPALNYKKEEIVKKSRDQILALTNHFILTFGKPEESMNNERIDGLINKVVSGKVKDVVIFNWHEKHRNVDLSFDSREEGSYGVTLQIVAK